MVNAPRVAAQAIGAGFLTIISSRGGDYHRTQIVEVLGRNRFALEPSGLLPPAAIGPSPAAGALNAAIQREVATLTTIDSYIALGAVVVMLIVVLLVVPTYAPPPRIALAKQ